MNDTIETVQAPVFYTELLDSGKGWYYIDGAEAYIGPYDTEEAATAAYKQAKENV